ncbi:type II toxin-antitoxin system RelE/ParE family toxin [Bradyrhizobium sp. Ai1a-2]|uniref:type II toxin-antitoxin system RelE/ParE family toxin n=1 Tax=Bradyrhizobium sp. Ai1a-2 TaxID=196490 RepID=UPI000487F964|nr:type II toxin-antitoxin system RelE/ParE family toxin [Bradyrhizobium sp. Ai1a-2]
MSAVWSPEAVEDLIAIRAYIEQSSPAAAKRIVLHVMHNVEMLLSDNPEMGRPGRVPGTRELVIPKTPYIVPYRVAGQTVQVLRVFHGARRWPETL